MGIQKYNPSAVQAVAGVPDLPIRVAVEQDGVAVFTWRGREVTFESETLTAGGVFEVSEQTLIDLFGRVSDTTGIKPVHIVFYPNGKTSDEGS